MKKGSTFMSCGERMAIVDALRCVDYVIEAVDEDMTVCRTLELIKPDIFAKGGDRFSVEIPEAKICTTLGIQMVDGFGQKIQSSSNLISSMKT
jgi:bifunctional ADP-heptose synthase (sugar kinase/adenylyltransferase)